MPEPEQDPANHSERNDGGQNDGDDAPKSFVMLVASRHRLSVAWSPKGAGIYQPIRSTISPPHGQPCFDMLEKNLA